LVSYLSQSFYDTLRWGGEDFFLAMLMDGHEQALKLHESAH